MPRFSRSTQGGRATGVLIGEDRLVVTVCKRRPLGTRVVSQEEVPCDLAQLRETVRSLDERGALPGRVVFGLDSRRTFFLAQRATPDEVDLSPTEILARQVGGSSGGLVGSVENIKLPGGLLRVVTGSPAALARDLVAAASGWPAKRYQMLSTPALLYRAARRGQSRRRGKLEIRVLTGHELALAILSYAGHPIAARHCDLPAGQEAGCIEVAVRGLRAYAAGFLQLEELAAIHLHAGPEAQALVAPLSAAARVPVHAAPPLELGPALESRLLAEAGLQQRGQAVDLLLSVRPPAGMLENLPVGTLVLLLGLLGGGIFLVHSRTSEAENAARKLLASAAKDLDRAGIKSEQLNEAHAKSLWEIEIAESFIVKRIYWGELLREVPSLLPKSLTLLKFDGKDLVQYSSAATETNKKKKNAPAPAVAVGSPQELTLIAQARLEDDESSPPEATQLTAALSSSAIFRRTFPLITGANVRIQSGMGEKLARIMVVCLPRKVGS